ncbi:MAG TPA: GntR family transcriptional regulator [Candidatus Ozemobacteraceae bacterium]
MRRVIRVDESSPVPIYQQIVEEVKRAVLTGVFGPDQRLPSIRELALELKVNPNTVAKAYQEMEAQRVIYFRRGQGAYISPRSEEERVQEAQREISRLFRQVLDIAHSLRLSRSRLNDLFRQAAQEHPDMKEEKP